MSNLILAIDTSSGTAVALIANGEVLVELVEPNTMSHAEQIGKLIAQAFSQSGMPVAALTAVAVGLGPAPFTGLRVGIAAAKFFAAGAAVEIFGVGSLDAIAFEQDLLEPTLVLTDARRGEVYFGLYQGKSPNSRPLILQGPGVKKRLELEAELAQAGIKYLVVEQSARASAVGRLALAQLADGTKADLQARYLRAPDAVAAGGNRGKRVSG
jgi:tRNA threonylcarbamoyladenosine biosynthesis protein TsaB